MPFSILLLLATSIHAAKAEMSPQTVYENGRIICSERIVPQGNSQIVSFANDGTDRKILVSVGLNMHPAVSRDGRRIVFSRRVEQGALELFEISADGGGLRQLTRGTRGGNIKPAYSPDGSRIAFMGIRHDIGHPEVWIMDVDGSNKKRLTHTEPVEGQQEIRGRLHVSSGHPSFSANGAKIYYSSTRSGSVQIWIMNADGSDQRRLTGGLGKNYPQANVPNVSADGRLITFWSGYEGRYGEIWLADKSDWKNPERLTDTEDPANSDDPVISPDGKKIVYGSGLGGDRAMYVLDIESRKSALLARDMQYCSWRYISR